MLCYSIDKTGFITELDLSQVSQVKKSGLTPLGKPSFAEDISIKINTPSTVKRITPVYDFVNNSFFSITTRHFWRVVNLSITALHG